MSDSDDDKVSIAQRLAENLQEREKRELTSSDEESMEEEIVKKPRKKQRRQNLFIEDQAQVDEDDSEEEEEEEEGFQHEQLIDDEIQTKNRHRALDTRKRQEEEMDAEAIAARYKERYGRQAMDGQYRGDQDHVSQRLLIPSVQDPKLWLVACKPGKEQDIIFTLMRKFFDLQGTLNSLQILSCFFRESIPGYVYLEAEKQADVMAAIKGVNFTYSQKVRLVPVVEMVDTLTIRVKESEVKLGGWVRVKRGKYAGDLGQVVEMTELGDSCTLKLIPRLDLSKHEDDRDGKPTGLRQPQKLFNPKDVNKREVQKSNQGHIYQKEIFDKDGYLEKDMKITTLITTKVTPTLEEITKFTGGVIDPKDQDLALLQAANQAPPDFRVGEQVICTGGELKNVSGIVKSIHGGIVTVIPDPLFQLNAFQYPARDLSKQFKEGDHVKVDNGVHKDETGLVVNVQDNVVTLLSDTTLKTVQVFSKDLRQAAEISGVTTGGQYDLEELVTLSPTEVGVVIKAEKDSYSVLNQYGNVIKVKPQHIRQRRDSSRAVTKDRDGKAITTNDTVQVIDLGNPGMKRHATILHVYRSFIFLLSREIPENGGIFVTSSSNVTSTGSRQSQQVEQNRFMPSVSRRPRRDMLVAKTGNINRGQWKGYLGIVKDTTETHVRVELHTNNRTVTVARDDFTVLGETPSAPSYTASTFGGSKTPMYRGESAATPNPYADGGNRTPGYGQGSRTPAWDAGSATPNPYSDRFNGSSTPAWNVGSSTPGHPADNPYTPANMPYQSALSGTPAAGTPGYLGHDTSTPYHLATPAGYPSTPAQPQTPSGWHANATPLPSTPAPAGAEYPVGLAEGWVLSDILVTVLSNHHFQNGAYEGRQGIVQQADGRSASVLFDTIVAVPCEYLAPVAPAKKKDEFKVISGPGIGCTGTLLSVDGSEGVVRLDGNSEIVMRDLGTLALYVRQ